MSKESGADLQFSVDRIVIKGRRVFGWGWATDRTRAIRHLTLHIEGDGWEARLAVNSGLERRDVESAFPGWMHAASSGFVATGYVPGERPRRMALEVELSDASRHHLDVTHVALAQLAERPHRSRIGWLAAAVWRRLKRGDLRGIVRRARAQNYGAAYLEDEAVGRALDPLFDGQPGACLVFDHNMGGGANHYRRRLIEERIAAGEPVVLCTYNLPTLDYRIGVFLPGAKERVFRVAGFLPLEQLLEHGRIAEVFLNSPVSFDEPLVLAEWLTSMRRRFEKVRLTVTIHDYFSLCPSFVLLDADGRFCGVPGLNECASCMKRHDASYVSLSPPTEIGAWRALWGNCLKAADEVRCFSDASRRLLERAYPDLPAGRVTTLPHVSDYVPARLPQVPVGRAPVIGIVGQISPQKGAHLVKELVERLERERPEARVVVVGTLDLAVRSERLHVTGPYRRDALPDLIEAHGINVLLFPSIWPETFSYVVSEMMSLQMPIVAFDLGAPADRLRTYPKALLCGEVSASAALRGLAELHARFCGAAANQPPFPIPVRAARPHA